MLGVGVGGEPLPGGAREAAGAAGVEFEFGEQVSGANKYVHDYRLAPEQPDPAPVKDAYAEFVRTVARDAWVRRTLSA
ncbi:hypothetical protein [Microbispora sp. NPDC046933]|uniref:hypothetical protein n=1 Tax=Microbispora sp. NPDC046933 TaxID=3155618 RepID=UPI0033D23C95